MNYIIHSLKRIRFFVIILIITLVTAAQLHAETAPPDTTATPKPKPVVKEATVDTPTVKNLTLPKLINSFRVGDLLEIDVKGSPELQKSSARELILYINELPMEGLHPMGKPVLSKDSVYKLTFLLNRDRDSVETFKAWNRFYRHPRSKEYPVTFSVGTAKEILSNKSVECKLELVKNDWYRVWILWIVTAVVGLLVIVISRRSELLKETNPIADSVFSLARTQIAWWTVVVLGSFFHLYFYTDELVDLSNSTMVLLGASAGTMISAKMIDSYKDYSHLVNQPKIKSRGFILDILSDGVEGVSVHRFQFVIWTLALTLVFLRGVIRELAMPEFPENLLILMGISNGTYLLLKLPENTKPITTAPATDPAINAANAAAAVAAVNAANPTNIAAANAAAAVAAANAANPTNIAAANAAAAVAAVNAASTAAADEAKEELHDNSTTPNVTTEGDVTRRDEEDMSGAPSADETLIPNPANQNQALG